MTGPLHRPTNPLVGQIGTTLSDAPRESSLLQMQQVAGTASRLSSDQEERFRQASSALLQAGSQTHLNSLLTDPQLQGSPGEEDRRLQEALGWVEGGHRLGYYHAFRWLFVLVHHRLDNPQMQNQVVEYLQEFSNRAEQYREFFQNDTSLSPLDQFRYLHHTARIARTLLARVEDSPQFVEAHPRVVAGLRNTLSHIYSDLLDDAQGVAVRQMDHGEISPLATDIQMRQALLTGNFSEARSLAWQLIRFYENNPLASEAPEASEELWIWRAGHEILEDGLAVRLANQLHVTSDAEQTQMMLNSLAAELVVQAAASVDGINREDEATIQNRYEAYSTVVTALILAHPGMGIEEITERLAHEASEEELQDEIDRIAETHPDIAERFEELQADGSESLLTRARASAVHILECSEGPGADLIQAVFNRSASLTYNPVAQVREAIADYPQIIADLELAYDHGDHEGAALELLRSGDQAILILNQYAMQIDPSHRASVQAIAQALSAPASSEDILNQFTAEMVEIYAAHLRTENEATFAGVVNSLHLINGLEEYADGVPVHEALRNQTGEIIEEMDGFGFGLERAFNNMTTGDSLWSLAAGAAVAEFLPAFMLARAGTTARAGNLGRLVSGGVLTWRARILTGVVTGATMSLVGTSLHHRRRAAEGLETNWGMYGQDLAVSAGMNTVVFGTTMAASAPLARALTPRAGAGATVTRMGLGRRLALRAGTAVLGGTVALGTSVGFRLASSGHLSTSWEEVAENYMAMILFETMAAGMRWARHRVGIRAELRGTPQFRGLSRGERIAAMDQIVLTGEAPRNTGRYAPETRSLGERAQAIEGRQAGRQRARQQLEAELADARRNNESERVTELSDQIARLDRQERFNLDRFRLPLYRNEGIQRLHEFLRFGSRARTRLGDAFRNRMAGIFNDFFTVIGQERVQQIDGLVDAMITAEPGMRNYRETLRYQLALREAAAPGSLDTMLARENGDSGRYLILDGVRPELNFETGVPRLEFVDASTERGPQASETITSRDLQFLSRQIEDMVPGQERQLTILQEINGQPGQVLRLYLHPLTRQIMSIGNRPEIPEGTRFEPLVYDAVVDPVARRILLPPLEEGGAPSELPYGEAMDYYHAQIAQRSRLNPFGSNQPTQGQMRRISPFSWNQAMLARLQQMMQPAEAQGFRQPSTAGGEEANIAQMREVISSGELPSRVWVIVETGPSASRRFLIMDPNTPAEQMPRLPEHHIRLEGDLNRFTQTITLPPTVEMAGQGEVVLNFENATVTTRATPRPGVRPSEPATAR